MRRVTYYEWVFRPQLGQNEKVEAGTGYFHQFGTSYDEFEAGLGNYTTAIIELEDGSVIDVPAAMIKFTDTIEIMNDKMRERNK